MRAIRFHRFGGSEVLQVDEVTAPEAGAGQVVIEVRAIGVNPYETYQRDGLYPDLPLPHCPGRDCAGVVAEVGAGVEGFECGDRVYTVDTVGGAYVERVLVEGGDLELLPDGVSFEQGAAVAVPCLTAWRALFERGGAKAGETILIHGASGSVGMAALQLAKAAGLRVYGTAGSEAGLALLRELGADGVHRHGEVEALQAASGGFDLILEMLANRNLGQDLKMLRRRGRVVVIGNRGATEINARDLMNCEGEIRAMMLFKAEAGEMAAARAGVRRALAEGVLVPRISRGFPLERAAEAQDTALESGLLGKVVLLP